MSSVDHRSAAALVCQFGRRPAAGITMIMPTNAHHPKKLGEPAQPFRTGVYLCSPIVAVASALTGAITDPRTSALT